ncbi:nucleotidyltransferase domain-containing protein [Pedobacter cryotolerans]|uniref:Nucleotidyltransferase domain-containing protein n=1 Tax=Pedobacter cryotolerans TaxID=2571270 RepID=A0A4U1C9G9_9SPHI|nr:nucleotidyltransferase domain-containing protein [Pedobacter cryotolerans]TKC03083.1 nucleotidyltransferase domain-containing protein [Pedobacter cryotolerans]
MTYGLTVDEINKIKKVFKKYKEVDKVIIYGSRAKGNFKPFSDIDITFIGENLNLKTINEIAVILDDLMLPYTFDISIFSQISNPDLIEHINRVGIIFYE